MATLCERVELKPGGEADVIGIFQRVGGPLPALLECQAVVAMASGASTTTLHVRLEILLPGGQAHELWSDEVRFRGDERIRAIATNLRVRLDEPGLYWFDVYLGEHRATRFQLRVEPEQTATT